MKFNPERYVARGVPRISQRFLEQAISSNEPALEGEDYRFSSEDYPLLWLVKKRKDILLGSALNFESYSMEETVDFADREHGIAGALIRRGLIFAAREDANLSNETGLPVPSIKNIWDFYGSYLKRAEKSGAIGSSYLIENLEKSDPLFYELLDLIWKIKKDRFILNSIDGSEDKIKFIIRAGLIGVKDSLRFLVSQNRTYNLEDGIGGLNGIT